MIRIFDTIEQGVIVAIGDERLGGIATIDFNTILESIIVGVWVVGKGSQAACS
jgi:hypothetical protein